MYCSIICTVFSGCITVLDSGAIAVTLDLALLLPLPTSNAYYPIQCNSTNSPKSNVPIGTTVKSYSTAISVIEYASDRSSNLQ